MTRALTKGDVVKFHENLVPKEFRGYYRITSIRGQYANLGSIFGNTIFHKRISLDRLVECRNEWYEKWSQSESYMCM